MIEMISLFHVLVADNLQELKEFYEIHFGFQAVYYEADFYVHLLHPATGSQLGFLVPDHPTQPEFLHSVASSQGMVISFEVRDAATALETARQAGLDIVFDLTVEEFGQTHFMVKDPAGFIVDIVENHAQ